MTAHLLIAEDEPVQRQMLTLLLEKKLGYQVTAKENGVEALAALRAQPIDYFSAVLLDIQMPVMDGFETLRNIRRLYPDLPVLMLTAQDDTETAVKAIKEGATDFIVKPAEPAKLGVVIANALRLKNMAQELSRLKRDKEGSLAFTDLIGCEDGLKDAVGIGRKAAAALVPVLIQGETGVGKELFARALHGESKRAGKPFIAINCGAIPANLVESILFGHEKGAFTSATSKTIGKFREADGGTIFLDEIGELPLDAQVKLLRVLQQQEVEPVGAGKPVKVDVRILSATNRDLRQEVKQGHFREDLYFRLNVLPIQVPALRERKQDIVPLAEAFLKRFAASDGLPVRRVSKEAAQYLTQHAWPGNVRELENLMHRALVLSDGATIERDSLEALHESAILSGSGAASAGPHIALLHPDGVCKKISEIEAEAMQLMLDYYGDNITRTAEALDMAKSTFYRKLKESPDA